MQSYKKLLSIPTVEASSNKVVGTLCSSKEALTKEELDILAQIRNLHQQATKIKKQIKIADKTEEEPL
jgi:hypothetical protein